MKIPIGMCYNLYTMVRSKNVRFTKNMTQTSGRVRIHEKERKEEKKTANPFSSEKKIRFGQYSQTFLSHTFCHTIRKLSRLCRALQNKCWNCWGNKFSIWSKLKWIYAKNRMHTHYTTCVVIETIQYVIYWS